MPDAYNSQGFQVMPKVLFRVNVISRVFWRCLFLSILFIGQTHLSYAAGEEENPVREIQVVADDLQYQKENKTIVATGNVVVTHGAVQLSADRAEINVETKAAKADGHVVIHDRTAGGVLSGETGSYNFDTAQGSFPKGRFYRFPWYGKGERLEQKEQNVIVAHDVVITSCDLSKPHYDVKAQKATLYPEDKIIATNVVFRILEIPVFWWPYLIIPLNQPFGYISPGYSDEFGGFMMVGKGFSINKNINGRLLFDWYSKRGFGFGAETKYKFDRLGAGEIKIYGIRDQHSPNERAANPFESASRDEKNRGRVSWKHKMRLDPYTTLQSQWHELSDSLFLQDFFEHEHRAEINPQSFVTLTRNAKNYSLLTHVEKRTNRFQSVDEKLPELAFTWLRKPLFGTNFYYTNEEGFVNFKETKAFAPEGAKTIQLYTDQELSYPTRFFKFYNFNPFINFREDFYTEGRTEEEATNRYAMGFGFDASTRFYRSWDIKGKPFGIEVDGLRHVLEPVVAYNTNKLASVEASRIINTGRGNDIGLQDIVTFGVENRIQTKRHSGNSEQRIDLVSFNTFLDLSFGPGSDLLETTANKFTQARVETVFRPYDWLQLRDQATYDFVTTSFSGNNLDLAIDRGPFRFQLGHRLSHSINADGQSQVTVMGDYTINPRWEVGGYIRWEATKNTIDEWELRARRDLHDWLLDFGYNVRNSNRTNPGKELNKEVFVELTLKALEAVHVKSGHRASFSEPRIGKAVSGANEAPVLTPLQQSPRDTIQPSL